MAQIYDVLEITCDGVATGKYRMTERSDESSASLPLGLCDHEHGTREEARLCPDARSWLDRIFPDFREKCLTRDSDGHWYVIPVEDEAAFQKWDEWMVAEDEDAEEPAQKFDHLALGCDPSLVTFREWRLR